MTNAVTRAIDAHLELVQSIRSLSPQVEDLGAVLSNALHRGRKILLIGNGGSAADAQHIAAEIVGRFEIERDGLPALALTTDSSTMTSIANDYGFESIFSRQVEALGHKGDALIAISTSGQSVNIIKAVETAKKKGLTTVGLLGKTGGQLADLVEYPLIIPSDNTARIQEVHILIGHILCQLIEESVNVKEADNVTQRNQG